MVTVDLVGGRELFTRDGAHSLLSRVQRNSVVGVFYAPVIQRLKQKFEFDFVNPFRRSIADLPYRSFSALVSFLPFLLIPESLFVIIVITALFSL